MKIGIAALAFVVASSLSVMATPAAHYTPLPKSAIHKAGCVAVQVCQQCTEHICSGQPPYQVCYDNVHQCNCHMECAPGIH